MKRFFLLLAGFVLFISNLSKADEGMWLLPLIQKFNIQDMQAKGLKLSAEEIYSVNNTSLKDAIVIFGGGCTGEIISDQGLILTNHHCGYGSIQRHSSPENDYLKDGFWAMSLDKELPTPRLSVTFLVKLEDVTAQVDKELNQKMTEDQRTEAIEKISKKISDEASAGTHYKAMVRSYYGGNQFFLLVYEVFTDVRMVGAPPSSIGKFGADTDNWMWPRHTGDFALFRVYADKDNKPAAYSPDNVPYKPKHHLPVSLKGVEKGDYTMILGYPGRTTRYMTSWEVEETQNITNANRAYIRGIRQEILLEDMLSDDAIRIKYANKYQGSSNYWKYSIGQNQALKQLKVLANKQKQEQEFEKWVKENKKRIEKYGNALNLIKDAVALRNNDTYALQYLSETLLRGAEIFSFASRFESLEKDFAKASESGEKIDMNKYRETVRSFFKDYNAPTDVKVSKAMIKLFANKVDPSYHPTYFEIVRSEFGNSYDNYIDYVFENSMFADTVKIWQFIENPSLEALQADPAYIAAKSVNKLFDTINENIKNINKNYNIGHRLYVAGILEKNQDKPMYPDANSTMRLTYGQVLDYFPKDAVHYNYITTLKGVMEKEDPDNWEFVVPDKLKELYNSKDFGPYAMSNGEMPIAFISNNDITGGNSGSPVLNAYGHLIGCAFDGNWEAMSGDIIFEPDYQRTISVDIRYVLFIIDKYAGAKHLVNEMTLIK